MTQLTYGNHTFDSVPFIPFQPLQRAFPSYSASHQPPVNEREHPFIYLGPCYSVVVVEPRDDTWKQLDAAGMELNRVLELYLQRDCVPWTVVEQSSRVISAERLCYMDCS